MRTCIERLDGRSHVRRGKDHIDAVELSSDFVTREDAGRFDHAFEY